MKMKTKKPIYRELGEYLGTSEQNIKMANPKKRELMILGLWLKKEIEANEKETNEKLI